MKTKLFLTALTVVALSFSAMAGDGTLKIDAEASEVAWKGTKVGGAHEGNIDIAEGHLVFEGGKITGGEFVIDMTTITCTDLKNEQYNAKLVGHLNAPDFFHTTEFPKASFKITGAEKTGEHTYMIAGDITIKDITEKIKFEATMSHDGATPVATADIEIDRTLFGIKYKSKTIFKDLGDNFIHDIFTLSVKLVGGESEHKGHDHHDHKGHDHHNHDGHNH